MPSCWSGSTPACSAAGTCAPASHPRATPAGPWPPAPPAKSTTSSAAPSTAVRWRYLSVNVAAMAEAPTPNKAKPDPPSAAEAAALLNDAWTDPAWGLMLWLTMVTGCRRGELCALRWRHLDIQRSTLWVSRSTSQPKSGIKEKDTKNEGERRIGLDSQTMVLLAQHQEVMAQQFLRPHRRYPLTLQQRQIPVMPFGLGQVDRRHAA